MKRFEKKTNDLHVTAEIDECPAVIVGERDFTPEPLYLYGAGECDRDIVLSIAAQFREIAEWLEGLDV